MANTARFEESSEIVIDTEVEAPAAGWALGYASVNRVGSLVVVHIEASWLINAAALVTTLQADFAPGATVTSADKNWTIGANGQVQYVGSKAAAGSAVLDISFQAGVLSP